MADVKVYRKTVTYKDKQGISKESTGNFLELNVNGVAVEIRIQAWNKYENAMLNKLLPVQK